MSANATQCLIFYYFWPRSNLFLILHIKYRFHSHHSKMLGFIFWIRICLKTLNIWICLDLQKVQRKFNWSLFSKDFSHADYPTRLHSLNTSWSSASSIHVTYRITSCSTRDASILGLSFAKFELCIHSLISTLCPCYSTLQFSSLN